MPRAPGSVTGTDRLRDKITSVLVAPVGGVVTKKPATLAYGLEETPPRAVIWISAAQHVGVCAIFMVYPLIIADEIHLPADEITNILQLGFLVVAIATVLQALRRGPVGSRLLAPSIFTGVYLVPSLLAVKVGGMPLVWGMTIFAGCVEIVLSRVWLRMRPFIPPESAGLVVFLIGAIIGLAALHILLEDNPAGVLTVRDGLVTLCALAAMAAFNIWNKGRLKLFCILIGMVAGYFVAAAVGLLSLHDLGPALHQPFVAIPSVSRISWSFDWSMVVPFAVSGLAAAMNSTAVVTTYQRLTDAEWVRPEMNSIARGIFGDGISTVISGLLGTYGVTISSANVGIVAATGVASRVIAFAVAAVLAVAALLPKLIGVLTVMPRPVMAAAMLFTSFFIMISGVQIISSRILDGRRTLVIGSGLMAFFVVSVYPMAFAGAPQWAQPLVTSPLVLATLVALGLNLIFRIGIRRRVTVTIDPGALNSLEIPHFIERNAGMWGARRDVISRLEFAVQQAIEAVIGHCEPRGKIGLDISFDEFVVDAVVTYQGEPLEFPAQAPSKEELLESDDGYRRLAGFLIRHHADRMTAIRRNEEAIVRLHFDH